MLRANKLLFLSPVQSINPLLWGGLQWIAVGFRAVSNPEAGVYKFTPGQI